MFRHWFFALSKMLCALMMHRGASFDLYIGAAGCVLWFMFSGKHCSQINNKRAIAFDNCQCFHVLNHFWCAMHFANDTLCIIQYNILMPNNNEQTTISKQYFFSLLNMVKHKHKIHMPRFLRSFFFFLA